MTDLIEKVARAICLNRAAPACRCTTQAGCQANTQSLMEHSERPAQARAAIKAVAEWLHLEDDEYDSESTLFHAAARLKKELEGGE